MMPEISVRRMKGARAQRACHVNLRDGFLAITVRAKGHGHTDLPLQLPLPILLLLLWMLQLRLLQASLCSALRQAAHLMQLRPQSVCLSLMKHSMPGRALC